VCETFAGVFAAAPGMAWLQRIHELPTIAAAWRKMAARKLAGKSG
jgi:hypothetical protein